MAVAARDGLKGLAGKTQIAQWVRELNGLPGLIQEALKLDDAIELLAERLVEKSHALFLGRGSHYPIAMEGALKLKEISYIHAEAYPAGELKHGPLALVDHVAVLRGTDVDQPRNLAKSVTVE